MKDFEVSGFEYGLLRWGTQNFPNCTYPATNDGRDLVTDFTLHNKKAIWLLETGEKSTQTLTEDPEWLDIPIYLFALNANGNAVQYSLDKIYFFRLFNGQELVQELIPVLDADGTPCMYDKISRKCFYNSGTGAFIAGLATIDDVRTLYLAPTGGSITLSVPAETPQGYIAALQRNNPNWTISIQYRES